MEFPSVKLIQAHHSKLLAPALPIVPNTSWKEKTISRKVERHLGKNASSVIVALPEDRQKIIDLFPGCIEEQVETPSGMKSLFYISFVP
jgi:ubiquinone biosynthesis protein COQ9